MRLHHLAPHRLAFVAAASLLFALATGCASSKVESTQNNTSTAIALNSKNYRLIQPGAHGQSYGFRLLGIIPFASPHYANAKQSLYASVHEPLTGRAVALANEMEDKSTTYLILFSIPKVSITADVIEFTDRTESTR